MLSIIHKLKRLRKNILRSAPVMAVANVLLFGMLLLLCRTSKWEEVGLEHWRNIMKKEKNAIMLAWHGRLLAMPFIWQGWNIKQYPVSALVSPHEDGRIIAALLKKLGFGIIDGSTNKNPKSAALDIFRALKNGKSIALIPDGPQGPRMHLGKSPVYFAKKTGKPIFVATYSAFKAKVIEKSWDKFMIPKPFSHGIYMVSEPFYVKANATEEEMEQIRKSVEDALNQMTYSSDVLMNVRPIMPSDERKHSNREDANNDNKSL